MRHPTAYSVVPSPSTPQGGSRRFVLEEVLITNLGGADSFAASQASFRMSIPSTRLAAGIAIVFLAANGAENAAIPPSWKVTIDAWKRTKSGLFVRANNIITDLPLPTVYEVTSTTVDQWRGVVTVPSSSTGVVPGQLLAIATWEPAPGDCIPDRQLEELFHACKLDVSGIVTTEGE